jgi:type VI protein secretion system component VasK
VNTLSDDANRLWRERFHDAFTSDCATRHPFAAEGPELDPQVFARLFGAKSGRLWGIAGPLSTAAGITVLGKPLLPLSAACRDSLAAAGRLRGLLYHDGGDAIALPVAVRFHPRAGINDMRLSLGSASVGLYDAPDRRARLVWTQDGPATSQVSIIVEDDRRLSVSFNDQPWSLLRLIASGKPQPHPDGGALVTWELTDGGRTYTTQMVIDLDLPAAGKQLAEGLFSQLRFPPLVTP